MWRRFGEDSCGLYRRKTGRRIQKVQKIISKKTLLGNAFLEEAPALGDAELLFICLLVAVGALGGFPFELLASVPIPYIQNGRPLFDSHPSFHAPLIRTLLSSLGLPVGHAFPRKLSQVPAYDILLRRLLSANLLILFAQCPLAHGRRRSCLGHAIITGNQKQPKCNCESR
jgi:hypothetical protein